MSQAKQHVNVDGIPTNKSLIQKFTIFLCITIVGTLITFGLLFLGIHWGMSPFYANVLGDILGTSFIFFTSGKAAFISDNGCLIVKFAVYLLYVATMIFLVSFWVEIMSQNTLIQSMSIFGNIGACGIAKAVIIPVTLTANFIVNQFLHEKSGYFITCKLFQ
ncbi:hypothetical protein FACS189454_01580 [Planctomycetales bacterium]|nr:hypothetical protein FACS189454_01580 [Planctomycetales bacterium]